MIEHASHQIDSPVMLAIAAGAGLKPEYAEDIFGQPRQVDFFEIHAENYIGLSSFNSRRGPLHRWHGGARP